VNCGVGADNGRSRGTQRDEGEMKGKRVLDRLLLGSKFHREGCSVCSVNFRSASFVNPRIIGKCKGSGRLQPSSWIPPMYVRYCGGYVGHGALCCILLRSVGGDQEPVLVTYVHRCPLPGLGLAAKLQGAPESLQ